MAGRINLNKSRPGLEKIGDNLMKTAADAVTDNASSIFNDTLLGRDMNSMLKLDNSATQFIDRNMIYPNPLNVPYMEEITKEDFFALKTSIQDIGLMHNLVVIDDGKGKYRLLSGEKRWQAISLMTDSEYQKALPNGIEAKVLPFNEALSKDDELIMLLTCNVLVFSSGSPEPKQMRDLIRLYEKKGYERKELVEFLNFYLKKNEKTVYKILAESKAIDDLYELYKNKTMSRSALQILGDLDEDKQKEVIAKIKEEKIEKVDEGLASSIKKSMKESSKKKKSTPINRSLQFIKFEKSLTSASNDLEKTKKLHYSEMESTEIDLAIAKLELMQNQIKEIKEQIKIFEKHN